MSDQALNLRARQRLGTVLRGKYKLESILGIGGMAIVYKATHRNGAEFAVKMLRSELSEDQELRSRFLREGYVANSVKHPGAVNVIDDDVSDDGIAFLVMELLHGINCDSLIDASAQHVPPAIASAICIQMLDVLASAHDKDILHRDLKPANLFVTNEGAVKLLDFGVARVRDLAASAPTATQTGVTFGTPAFMAPEQSRGDTKAVDERTDIWATGATLFTLMTGRFVHEGDNAAQITIKSATKPAVPLQSVVPAVPQPLADVVDRALAFEQNQRWPSAVAMRDALIAAHRASFGQEPSREVIATFLKLVGSGKDFDRETTRRIGDRDTTPERNLVGATTAQPVETERAGSRASPAKVVFVVAGAAIGALAIFAVGIGIVWPALHHESVQTVAASTSSPVRAVVTTPDTAPSLAPLATGPTIAASALPIASTPAPAIRTTPRPTPTVKASPSAKAKPGCDPPYTIDAQGNRHFKDECYD